MKEKNHPSMFYPEEVFLDKKTGKVRVDCYGDRKHFKLKEEYISELWELGFLVFMCFRALPPYTRKSSSDVHYSCLVKGSH